MTNPLPDWAMEKAREKAEELLGTVWRHRDVEIIAAALLSAYQQGKLDGHGEAAEAIQCDCCDVCGESPDYENVCANELTARIRRLDEVQNDA